MYKGRHYSRALLKKQARRALDRYLLVHENHGVHKELPMQDDYQVTDLRRKGGHFLPPAGRFFYPSEEAKSADRLVLLTCLNYLVNARPGDEQLMWWRNAQEYAARLGLRDYRMSIFTKSAAPEESKIRTSL